MLTLLQWLKKKDSVTKMNFFYFPEYRKYFVGSKAISEYRRYNDDPQESYGPGYVSAYESKRMSFEVIKNGIFYCEYPRGQGITFGGDTFSRYKNTSDNYIHFYENDKSETYTPVSLNVDPIYTLRLYKLTNADLAAFLNPSRPVEMGCDWLDKQNPLHFLLSDAHTRTELASKDLILNPETKQDFAEIPGMRANFGEKEGELTGFTRFDTAGLTEDLKRKYAKENDNAAEISAMLQTILNYLANNPVALFTTLLHQDADGNTPFHLAFSEKYVNYIHVIMPLIKAFGTLTRQQQESILAARNNKGETILTKVCQHFPANFLDILIQNNWQSDLIVSHAFAQHKDHDTPFIVSFYNKNVSEDFPLKLLGLCQKHYQHIQVHNKLTQTNSSGLTVLHHTMRSRHGDNPARMETLMGVLGDDSSATELTKQTRDKKGWTPLHYACRSGNLKKLLAAIDLHLALDHQQTDMITIQNQKRFTAAKEALALNTYNSISALELVCQYGNPEMLNIVFFCLGPRKAYELYEENKGRLMGAISRNQQLNKEYFELLLNPMAQLFKLYHYLKGIDNRVTDSGKKDANGRLDHFCKILETISADTNPDKKLSYAEEGAFKFQSSHYKVLFIDCHSSENYYTLFKAFVDTYNKNICPYPDFKQQLLQEFRAFLQTETKTSTVAQRLLGQSQTVATDASKKTFKWPWPPTMDVGPQVESTVERPHGEIERHVASL